MYNPLYRELKNFIFFTNLIFNSQRDLYDDTENTY